MNFTLLAFLLYAVATSVGIIGIGHVCWSVIRSNFPQRNTSTLIEHPLLTLGICYLHGYLFYETTFFLLALAHLFHPAIVTTAGGVLFAIGTRNLYRSRRQLILHINTLMANPLETAVLFSMLTFVFFWNLYPMYDIDSMFTYLPSINNQLLHRGVYFSPYEIFTNFGPLGSYRIYALGLSLSPTSSTFAQIMHGLSKAMLIMTAYGAARALGLGTLSLLTPALILSEEHIIASGTNGHVHINIVYTLSIFLLYYSVVTLLRHNDGRYFYVGLNAMLFAVTCKYAALYHMLMYGLLLPVICTLHPDIRKLVWRPPSLQLGTLQIAMAIATSLQYYYRWYATGSPVFPTDIGPFHTMFYDRSQQVLLHLFHYGLTFADALKTLTSFMVWPGILSSKILLPLAFLVASTLLLRRKSPQDHDVYGAIFLIASVIIVLVQQITFVFEMRYYRFGIGIYALCATFLVSTILRQLFESHDWLQSYARHGTWAMVLLVSAYSVHYSFDVMRDRPTFTEIVQFIKGTISEKSILEKHHSKFQDSYRKLLSLHLDNQQLGLILTMTWPEFVYPVPGRQIGFGKTGAIPSYAYFDEGSFARELRQRDIQFIFNQLAKTAEYPLPGGAVYAVLRKCGTRLTNSDAEFLKLSTPCLDQLAIAQNIPGGIEKLNTAVFDIAAKPSYEAFNPPPYGTDGWMH